MRSQDPNFVLQHFFRTAFRSHFVNVPQVHGTYYATVVDTDATNSALAAGTMRIIIPALDPNAIWDPIPYHGKYPPPNGKHITVSFDQISNDPVAHSTLDFTDNELLYGPSDPTSNTGNVGDIYINTTTSKIFGPKTASGWGVGTPFAGGSGSQGPQGYQGSTGATGAGGALGYYGSFYDTSTQTNPVANAANLLKYNSNDSYNGVTVDNGVGGTNGKITIANPGEYNFQFSVQALANGNNSNTINIWMGKHGTAITGSNGQATFQGKNIIGWNFYVAVTSADIAAGTNDYSFYWSCSDTGVTLPTIAAASPVPSTFSVVMTVQQVMYTQVGPQGYQGYQGNVGANGSTGTQGSQGYQGYQGQTGSGTQGAQGYQGYQGNIGSTGSQGSQGYQGYQGQAGTNGTNGTQGAQGYQGYQGQASTVQGPQGSQGYQGYQGQIGTTGNQGNQGSQGYQGYQGQAGTNGTNGSQGSQGYQGYQGQSGTNGTNGSQGAQGYQGYQGNAGSNGTNGAQGAQGYQGYQGNAGTNGTNGTNGAQGSQGYQGYQGNAGSSGSQGSQGYQGYQGNQGVTGLNTSSTTNVAAAGSGSGGAGTGYASLSAGWNQVTGATATYSGATGTGVFYPTASSGTTCFVYNNSSNYLYVAPGAGVNGVNAIIPPNGYAGFVYYTAGISQWGYINPPTPSNVYYKVFSGSISSGTQSITVPSTTAYMIQSDTGGVFTTNSSGAQASIVPSTSRLLVGTSSDTQITVSAQTQPPNFTATTTTLPTAQLWYGLATDGAGNWVATPGTSGTAAAVSTNNGTTWSASTMATAGIYAPVAYGNGVWIAIASGAGANCQIYNGSTWSNGGAVAIASSAQLAYGNVNGTTPTFVASNPNAGGQPYWSTNNGTTWTAATGVGVNSSGCAYGNGKFMVVQGNGGGCYTSTDGKTWSNVNAQGLPGGTVNWQSLAYGAGRWVAINTNNNTACVSTNDGVNWTAVRLPFTSGGGLSVAFGGGYFVVAQGATSFAAYSADGYNWMIAVVPAAIASKSTSIAYGNGYWNAIANASGTANYQWLSNSLYPVRYTITPTSYNATS